MGAGARAAELSAVPCESRVAGMAADRTGRETVQDQTAVEAISESDRPQGLTAGVYFTSGTADAVKFGTHEIVLTGNGTVTNPFDTIATVTFTPPSGSVNAKTVYAFYDGGSTWRARVYVSESGLWTWASSSATDAGLNGKSGSFNALSSSLRGMLKPHASNPKALMTDDGRWFANVSDTAYLLFHGVNSPLWQQFVSESYARGIRSIRAAALGGWGGTPGTTSGCYDPSPDCHNYWVWNDPWAGGANPDYTRYDLSKFQNTDQRLIWIFDNYPRLYLQMTLFGLKGFESDNTGALWFSIPQNARNNTMRYMIARWSAFPNLYWLIVNDMSCTSGFPNNLAFAREVGNYFAANEPWKHLNSVAPTYWTGNPFTGTQDRAWCTYVHIEEPAAAGATQIAGYGFDAVPVHVFMGEDWYEQDNGHYTDARFYFRWLMWSWILSGGSANYCGRWGVIHPYTETWRTDYVWTGITGIDYTGQQLVGLDSMMYLTQFFEDRGTDMGLFFRDDTLAQDLDGRTGKQRPIAARRGSQEIIVYHPNTSTDSYAAVVDSTRTARMHLDLTNFPGPYNLEWYRPLDGLVQTGQITGGAPQDFVAPWSGSDVVLHLTSAATAPDGTPPSVSVSSPAPVSTVAGVVSVTANATDNVGVAGVQFLLDGANLGAEEAQAPYTVQWNTRLVPNGWHTLAARARDAAGNSALAGGVSVIVSNGALHGLVAAYSFDDGSGSLARDSSGFSYDGNVNGATWTSPGHTGSTLAYDGAGHYVEVPNSPGIDIAGAGITISMWVNITDSATDCAVLTKPWTAGQQVSPYYQYGVEFNAGRKQLDFYFTDTRGVLNGPWSMTPPLGSWTYMAYTYDGTTLIGYLGGLRKIVVSPLRQQLQARGTSLRIGVDSVYAQGFKGKIDDVRIYNRALTQAEVQADMASPVASPVTPVPDGAFGTPMMAAKARNDGSRIDLSWDTSGCAAPGHHALYGPLAGVGSYQVSGGVCGLGATGSYSWSGVPAGSLWFVVVGDNAGTSEGTWGTDGAGAPIKGSAASGVCGMTSRGNAASCP